MLTLYYKPSCPFCQRVLAEAELLGLQMQLKNVSEDAALREELVERGGKTQVPFLIDPERGAEMYESGDIVSYLSENYGQPGGIKVHRSDLTCDGCE